MTTRKLTPAEALECVKSMLHPREERVGRMTYCVRGVEVTKEECLAVIEKELDDYLEFSVQMHQRLRLMVPDAKGCTEDLLDAVDAKLAELSQKPPAAPVPSDEEIVAAIHRWRLFEMWHDKMAAMEHALLLLARRIGVQGVPQ